MKAINCKRDQAKFDALNKKVLKYLKNTFDSKGDKWCDPIVHPITGNIAFTVEERMLKALTQSENNTIFELTNDWFPKDNI